MRNAMDAQEVAVGWWPGDARYGKAAFYAYAHPARDGFETATLSPRPRTGTASWASSSSTRRTCARPPTRTRTRWSSRAPPSATPCIVCEWDPALPASVEGDPPPVVRSRVPRMRAAILREFGQPPEIGEFDDPRPGDGQEVVDVLAAGLNPVDILKASGHFYGGNPPLPSVVGTEGIARLADGRTVYFDAPVAPYGSFAERA